MSHTMYLFHCIKPAGNLLPRSQGTHSRIRGWGDGGGFTGQRKYMFIISEIWYTHYLYIFKYLSLITGHMGMYFVPSNKRIVLSSA